MYTSQLHGKTLNSKVSTVLWNTTLTNSIVHYLICYIEKKIPTNVFFSRTVEYNF